MGPAYLYEIVDFTSDSAVLEAGIDSLTDYVVQDNSTNLNGAVIYALDRIWPFKSLYLPQPISKAHWLFLPTEPIRRAGTPMQSC